MPSGARPRTAGARGPVARQPELKATGFRLDDRTRFELQAAGLFSGRVTLQSVLELAVEEFLARMHNVDGFDAALLNAERAQRDRFGIPTLPPRE